MNIGDEKTHSFYETGLFQRVSQLLLPMVVDMTKTEFMLRGSRQRLCTLIESPILEINNFQVSQFTTAKSLRVAIDNKLD